MIILSKSRPTVKTEIQSELKEAHAQMNRFQAIGVVLLFLASDSLGQTSIRMPPTIIKHPKKIIFFRGFSDGVTLECQAEGTPNITYKWEKNGNELDQHDKYLTNIRRGIGGNITIEPATSLDEGYYQCFGTNEHGTALSIVSHVHRAVLQLNPGATTVTNVTVREGESFHIHAVAVKTFPKPTYAWEVAVDALDIDSQPLPLSKRIQIADNGDLYFAYAKVEDNLNGKIYKSTVYNPYLDVKAGGSYTRVIVRRVPGGAANSAPTLGFSSEPHVVGLVNGSVTLRCYFNGNPEPTIIWKGPGNILPRDRHKLETFSTELIINNITASDEGNYTCTAENSAGQISHTIQLSIETEPSFKSVADRPHNVNVSDGDTVAFHCKADAKPEADVVWFRNGKTITAEDVPTKYVIGQDEKSLTVVDVCLNCTDRDRASDIVVIQCNASNKHGYAFASGYINVFERSAENGDDRNVLWTGRNIVVTVVATLIGSIIIFFLFNHCCYNYSRENRGRNSNERAEIEHENCTEEPDYETIPFDDLPNVYSPSQVIQPTYVNTIDILGCPPRDNRNLGIDCAEETTATTLTWDDPEEDDDAKEMNEYCPAFYRRDSNLALYTDLRKDDIEESV